MPIEIAGLETLPEVCPGDDLPFLIRTAAAREQQLVDRSVLVAVAQKIVSKAEGAIVDLRKIEPSAMARTWAAAWGKDPRLIEVILTQSRRIVKMDRGVLVTETRNGLVCANSGVDQSNAGGGDLATILPKDPDASAAQLRVALGCGAVVVTDTFGRRLPRLCRQARAAACGHDHRGRRSACRGSRIVDAQTGRLSGGAGAGFSLARGRRFHARSHPAPRARSIPVTG